MSFKAENAGAETPNYRIVGYKNGIAVPGATYDFTAEDMESTLVAPPPSDTGWENIDEFRIMQQEGRNDIMIFKLGQ